MMFKVLAILLALATCWTQAFPGSSKEPPTWPAERAEHSVGSQVVDYGTTNSANQPELRTTALETSKGSGIDIACFLQYFSQIVKVAMDSVKGARAVIDAARQLAVEVSECGSTGDTFTCVAQAFRDTWENNAELRQQILDLVKRLSKLTEDIQKCMNPQQRFF